MRQPSASSLAAQAGGTAWGIRCGSKSAHVDVDRRDLDFVIVPEDKKGTKKEAAPRSRPIPQRHPRSKRSDRPAAPEESPALRARRREKKRRRADRRGDNGDRHRP